VVLPVPLGPNRKKLFLVFNGILISRLNIRKPQLEAMILKTDADFKAKT
jgi:hypothetical protein